MPGIEDLEPGTANDIVGRVSRAQRYRDVFLAPHNERGHRQLSGTASKIVCGCGEASPQSCCNTDALGCFRHGARSLDDLAVAVGPGLHVAADEQGSGPAKHSRRAERPAKSAG